MADRGAAAGDFSSWLRSALAAVRGTSDADVPCDGCTACCRSSQFITIEPDEADALAHIPAALHFPAPGRPAGHVVLGYDERGHCPMLVDDACSIYEHRPRACRAYDCRAFAAAGITPDQPLVAERTRQWAFTYGAGEAGRDDERAVRAAAAFVREHPDAIDQGPAPVTPTRQAVLAVELHDLFLDATRQPSPADVRVELRRRRER